MDDNSSGGVDIYELEEGLAKHWNVKFSADLMQKQVSLSLSLSLSVSLSLCVCMCVCVPGGLVASVVGCMRLSN
jgi:hypothetical protein